MNDTILQSFRDLADEMIGTFEARRWEWVGRHMSQRMFGITQERAEEYARRYGGRARRMEVR